MAAIPTSSGRTPEIADRYIDDRGAVRYADPATLAALHAALDESLPRSGSADPIVTGSDWASPITGVVHLEDGAEQPVHRGEAALLPIGYHRLEAPSGSMRPLIVAPARCRQPQQRTWGVAAQLYGVRSRHTWGMGDLNSLGLLRERARRWGAGFVLVNPMHAAAPTENQENCPYSPVTRLFRNPIYLSVPDVPGARSIDLTEFARAGAELNGVERIDRDTVWRVKQAALRRIREVHADEAEFTSWRSGQPMELRRFAIWCTLSERFGASTTTWPDEYRSADSAAVLAFAEAHAESVDFHEWLQWLVARQLGAHPVGVIHDLAVGVAPDGADPWIWPDVFVPAVTIGAPPDALNTRGQDWGLAPLHPALLRSEGYEPFVRLLRATLQSSAGIRIDHVLGLFRLWMIPSGASPDAGAYVRYPADELLAVLALESHRAGVPIIGEDLGTVEDGVRERLDERGVMSCRVLLLDEQPPSEWPAGSIATATTHDLPTIVGLWTGIDAEDQIGAGLHAAVAETEALRHRLAERIGVRSADPLDALAAAHRLLAQAPSLLTAVSLDDLCGVQHRQNIPATHRPENWTRPLPVLVDELDDVLASTAVTMRQTAVAGSGDWAAVRAGGQSAT